MKDVHALVAAAVEKRIHENPYNILTRIPPSQLHPALEVALRNRFLLSRAIRLSAANHSWAPVGQPSRDRRPIDLWVDTWLGMNLALQTGNSAESSKEDSCDGVIALETEPALAMSTLVDLTGDEWEWQRTLHYAIGSRKFYLFRYAAGLRSLDGYPGLYLHAGDAILIPPSHASGVRLRYADPEAPLLPPPCWVFKPTLG